MTLFVSFLYQFLYIFQLIPLPSKFKIRRKMHEYKIRRSWSTRQKNEFRKIAEFGHVDKKTPKSKFSTGSFSELQIASDKENVYFTADESIVKRGNKLESFVAFDQNSQSKINAFAIDNGKCLGTRGITLTEIYFIVFDVLNRFF